MYALSVNRMWMVWMCVENDMKCTKFSASLRSINQFNHVFCLTIFIYLFFFFISEEIKCLSINLVSFDVVGFLFYIYVLCMHFNSICRICLFFITHFTHFICIYYISIDTYKYNECVCTSLLNVIFKSKFLCRILKMYSINIKH